VRGAAEDTILAMCDHDGFGTKMTMNAIVRSVASKNSSKTAKKTMNSNKQIIGKYQTLHRILQEVRIP